MSKDRTFELVSKLRDEINALGAELNSPEQLAELHKREMEDLKFRHKQEKEDLPAKQDAYIVARVTKSKNRTKRIAEDEYKYVVYPSLTKQRDLAEQRLNNATQAAKTDLDRIKTYAAGLVKTAETKYKKTIDYLNQKYTPAVLKIKTQAEYVKEQVQQAELRAARAAQDSIGYRKIEDAMFIKHAKEEEALQRRQMQQLLNNGGRSDLQAELDRKSAAYTKIKAHVALHGSITVAEFKKILKDALHNK